MADQIEVTKLNALVATGPGTDEISVPKLVVYLVLEPGEGTTTTGQGHVHTQLIKRSS